MGSCLGNDLLSDKLVVAADVDSNLRCVKALECLVNAFNALGKSIQEEKEEKVRLALGKKRDEVKLVLIDIMKRLIPQPERDSKTDPHQWAEKLINQQIEHLNNRNKWLEGLQWDRVNSGMREMLSYLATKQTEKKGDYQTRADVVLQLAKLKEELEQTAGTDKFNEKLAAFSKVVRDNFVKTKFNRLFSGHRFYDCLREIQGGITGFKKELEARKKPVVQAAAEEEKPAMGSSRGK